MADSFTDMVLGKSVKSQIDIQRWGEGLRKQVFGILEETQNEILREVFQLTPTARPLTVWKKTRLIEVNKQVNSILDSQYGKIKELSQKRLTSLASTTVVGEAKMVNNILGADIFDTVTLTEPMLRSLVRNTMIEGSIIGNWWDGQKSNFSKSFERQMNDAARAIQIGTIKGEAVGEMVRRIRGTDLTPGIMDVSRREATALVRTSTMQVANASRFEMYEANSDLIDGYQISATIDLVTTLICQGYDGMVFYRDETTGNYVGQGGLSWPGPAPYHWNCRTTLIPLLKSFADLAGPKSRISKKNLNRIEKKLDSGVRATMGGPAKKITYSDWLKKQPVAVQKEVLGPTRQRLWKEYGLSSADLLHQNGRPYSLAQLRRKLNVGASPEQVKAFIDEFGFKAVSPARVKRFIDDCF